MAAKGQRKEEQQGRAGPSIDTGKTSRVSKAAGSIGSQSMRVEQRSGASASRQRQNNPVPARSSRSSKQSPASSKKGSASKRPAPVQETPPPADSRIIGKMRDKWQSLEPHHQQRVYSIILLLLSLLLFAALTVWQKVSIFQQLSGFFQVFFGWAAYPLSIGLIAFALAHLIEGMRNIRFIRWSLVFGVLLMLLLLSAESRLLLGNQLAGVLGVWLSIPLLGWPPLVQHVLVLGLLALVAIYAFRLRYSHLKAVVRFGRKMLADPQRKPANNATGPSPYLGQRPKYSRYMGTAIAEADEMPGSPRRKVVDVEEDDEEDVIDFDFDVDFEDDDPLNDINLHKQQVGNVPRGSRPPLPMNRAEYQEAVKGARQQPLPFDERASNGSPAPRDQMEPLVPNPLLRKQPKIVTKAANADGTAPAVDSPWKIADNSLLNRPEEVKMQVMGDDTGTLAKIIQDTLRSFRVDAEVRPEDISIGPTVIRFGIRPTGKPLMTQDEKGRLVPVRDASGNIVYEQRTRVSRIMALQNDLALVLEAKAIRMEAPVPGRPYVGVEIPNKNSRLVTLREILESKEYAAAKAKSKLAMALGKDVAGAVRVGDLARMPHLLIAGATGAGKSVCLNAIIASFVTQATPDDVRMLMVDPKMVELNMYNSIPHLLAPVVTEVDKVVGLLKIAIGEMERRYRLFSQLGVRNLDGYRRLRAERIARGDETLKNLPAIVIIIDELADLMMAAPEEVEGLICRLAQLARATGIHLIIATQRPSVDVITGLIKANIPTRISFMVSSAVDSRTIIDMGGAERLLGRGDMLYLPADAGRPERIQGAFLADEEVERLVNFWRQQTQEHTGGQSAVAPPPVEPGWEIQEHISDDFELEDDLLEKAEEVVREYGRASISLLQRRLRIGYSRAARLIDMLEERGIIGSFEANGRPREVLDNGNGNDQGNGGFGPGRTMADEVADIIAEEKAREDFLKKQQDNQ